MGKAEKGTPKDIAKRIKSKGLQKLKFYCQLCEKQCRDANGFKCHMTSESHLRQMKIFSENASKVMDQYSRDFESSYLQTLKQRHTTKRVSANVVYQEVIQDKQHIHMNSTKWATLSDFVMYLGRKGKCKVDETERGWYVQYIEVDASILSRKAAQERRVQAELEAEQAQAARMAQQRVEAAKALDKAGGVVQRQATNLERTDNQEKVIVSLVKTTNTNNNSAGVAKKKTKPSSAMGFFDDKGDDDDDDDQEEELKQPAIALPQQSTTTGKRDSTQAPNGNSSNMEDGEHRPKRSRPSKDDNTNGSKKDKPAKDAEVPWLKRDIIVRIITQQLHHGKYFRQKAVVTKVLKDNQFCAQVEVLEGGDVLRLDQQDLETVVPKPGKKVKILKGPYRGEKATLLQADKKRYRATLELISSSNTNRDGKVVLEKVDFEDFSQLA